MASLVHIDVRRQSQQHGGDPYGFVVEASTDGGGGRGLPQTVPLNR